MTEGGPFYRFLLNDVELVDMPRAAFDQKHGISKYAQGYSFLRDNAENPTGVVFWWCRSNLEQHVKKDVHERQTWAITRKPIDPRSYRNGMTVYVGETLWDTGQHIEDPKYRIKGKLKEIIRIDGTKVTKLFPIQQPTE